MKVIASERRNAELRRKVEDEGICFTFGKDLVFEGLHAFARSKI